MKVNRLALLEKVTAAIAKRAEARAKQQEAYAADARSRLVRQIEWDKDRIQETQLALTRHQQELAEFDVDPAPYLARNVYRTREGGDELDELKLLLELNTETLVAIPTRSRWGSLYQTLMLG